MTRDELLQATALLERISRLEFETKRMEMNLSVRGQELFVASFEAELESAAYDPDPALISYEDILLVKKAQLRRFYEKLQELGVQP